MTSRGLMGEADMDGGTSVGSRLRAAREAAGLTLAEIAARTRVNARHLSAIESDDRASLPAAPYSVGFVKAYAREVGLDGVALGAEFRRAADIGHGHAIEAERYETSDPARLPSRTMAITAAVIAVLLIGGYMLWRGGTFGGVTQDQVAAMAADADETRAAVRRAGTLAPGAPVPPAPPPRTDGPVLLTANQPAWMRIYERDGTTLFQGELAAGQSYEVPATAKDPLIRTGRAEAVNVSVAGRPVAPLGPPARTVKDVSLLGAALLGRPAAAAPAAG